MATNVGIILWDSIQKSWFIKWDDADLSIEYTLENSVLFWTISSETVKVLFIVFSLKKEDKSYY